MGFGIADTRYNDAEVCTYGTLAATYGGRVAPPAFPRREGHARIPAGNRSEP